MRKRRISILLILLSLSCQPQAFAQNDLNININDVSRSLGATMNGNKCRYSRNQLLEIERTAQAALAIPSDNAARQTACALISSHANQIAASAKDLPFDQADPIYKQSEQMYDQAHQCYTDVMASIPVDKDANAGDWACLEAPAHIHNDVMNSCSPNPTTAMHFIPKTPVRIEGKESYHFASLPFLGFLGFHISKPYRYTMSQEADGTLGITVKIHFTGSMTAQEGMQALLQKKLDAAAEIWQSQSPGKKIHFHFLAVGANEKADFKVQLKPDAKGDLYYTYWLPSVFTENGQESTIAHELGHMMGIPDEYDPVRDVLWEVKDDLDTLRCNPRSMMCNHYSKKIYPYYYYLITRRGPCIGGAGSDAGSTLQRSLEQMQKLQTVSPPANCNPSETTVNTSG